MEERLVDELVELTKKYAKLDRFIDTEEFKQLDEVEQELLRAQFEHMQGYQTVLMHRIVIIMKK